VLVQMEMNDETWHLVKEVPRVLGFIGGSSDRPAPISDKEAERHPAARPGRRGEAEAEGAVRAGEMVRVTDGPFNDFRVRGGSQLRQEPAAGGRADPRALDAGRAGFPSGREGLSDPLS
jgi:hypothetical protein